MILASKSPRRKDIFNNIGIYPRIEISNIEEISNKSSIEEKIVDIARKKAISIAEKYRSDFIVAADTVVVLDNEILTKPNDYTDAKEKLKALSGKTHIVITGYSLINIGKSIEINNFDKTEVKIRNLDNGTIDWYINTNEPMDKAGAYGIQGYGSLLVEKINGDFFNVMGFPISKFMYELSLNKINYSEIK